jgi:hypothetical protein
MATPKTTTKTPLPLHTLLSLSMIHENIEKFSKAERAELFKQLAELNAHAARKATEQSWPPPALTAVRA